MDPKELVEQHKIYSEDLKRWVVPLEIVDQALYLKSAKELEENLTKLQDNMADLHKLFNNTGNING